MHFKNHYDIGQSRTPVPTGLREFVRVCVAVRADVICLRPWVVEAPTPTGL